MLHKPKKTNICRTSSSYKICFLFLLILLSNLFIFNNTTVNCKPNILISHDLIEEKIYAGEIKSIQFKIMNNEEYDLNYEMKYGSNLMYDNYVVGLWYFNDVYNDIIKDETLINNGTLIDGHIVKGIFGNAIEFDGINDYIKIPNSPSLNINSITLETWINIKESSLLTPLGGVKYLSYGILYDENGFILPHVWAGGLKWYEKEIEIRENEWNYVAMSYDSSSGELSCYLNGEKIETIKENIQQMDYSSYDFLIGRAWTENMYNYFNGYIDEIRISNTSRSSEEIFENYQRGISGLGEWVKISEKLGTIKKSEEKIINLTFNATNLSPGEYQRDLFLFYDDSENTYLKIPINLEVLPLQNDVALTDLNINKIIYAEEPTNISAIVQNLGNDTETNVNIDLLVDDQIIDNKLIPKLEPQEIIDVNFPFTFNYSREYKIQVNISPITGETNIQNNRIIKNIYILGYPIIDTIPKSIEVTAEPDSSSQRKIWIHNLGNAPLEYYVIDKLGYYTFWDDMEKGVNGWTHSGPNDAWSLGTPMMGPTNPYSGSNCWATGLDSYYEDNSNCSLISPDIELVQDSHPYLIFNHWYSIEEFRDGGYLEIWDGTKWNTVNPEGYRGYSNGWKTESYDLTNFTGENIKLRFRFYSDDDMIKDIGWCIDDIRIINPSDVEGDWLTQSPVSGEIDPENSIAITLEFNTTGLTPGRHEQLIVIKSNDQEKGEIVTPIILIVKGLDIIPPIANAGYDITSNEDEIVILDGSNSTDNFKISIYTWTFYDEKEIKLIGKKTYYNFTNPGIYNITLYTTDTSNNTDTDNLTITIIDTTKPIAKAGENIEKYVGNTILLNGINSIDNGQITSYQWDMGDGTKKEGSEITHTYTKPGTYEIKLTVIDFDGNADTDTITATIKPAEGSWTWLILIFFIFVFIILFFLQRFFIGSTKG